MRLQMKQGLIAVSVLMIVCLGTLWIFQSTSVEEIKVFKPAGNTKWPLTVDSGTIYCQWKEFIPGSNYRHSKRPLVLFKYKRSVYGVNGAASGVGGYPPIRRIMVAKRLWRYGATTVISEWIQAGLALCDGNGVKAQEAIERANANAAEPLPKGIDITLKTDNVSTNKRRIFLETVRCEDRAMQDSRSAYLKRIDELVRSGRRQEIQELSKQRLKKEDELMTSCKSALRKRERISAEDHKNIMSEGISRGWPLD